MSHQTVLLDELDNLITQAKEEGKPYTYEVLTQVKNEMVSLRAKLFPYADDSKIAGMSWGGFYLIGDEKSIKELRRIENRSVQLDDFRTQFDNRIKELSEAVKKLAEGLK